MSIYRLQYTHTINRITRDVIDYFEAASDEVAVTVANNRLPSGTINKKLYVVGTKVSL